MCGIAGILTVNASLDSVTTRIHRMQAALYHRGPDDQGIYQPENSPVALAHTRLAILDLSAAGHQPMATPDGRYWITFNGEIYNFQALRASLEAQGERFQSNTDTEVILALYRRMGTACVHHLRGMFAFAIWDAWEQSCFIARDPLGIKPLYYWTSGSTLVFASELKAVLASGWPKLRLNATGFYGYLLSGSVPEPLTLIDGIHTLPAGHWLSWKAGTVHQSSYWEIEFGTKPLTPGEAIATTRSALLDSIQHHFVSDVPVGLFLSGGIDSTAILALSRLTQSNDLQTFSIAFEEMEWNEGEAAGRIAHHFGTQHTEYTVTAEMGRSLLPSFLDSLDQPTIDGFNTFCVSQMAHQAGIKVVLSGVGGDEVFGGYKSFQRVPQMVQWGQTWRTLHPMGSSIGRVMEQQGRSARLRRLGDYLQQAPAPSTAYTSFRGIFSHWEAQEILNAYDLLDGGSPDLLHPHPLNRPDRQFPSLEDTVSWLELSRYMRNQLLRDSDRMSMAWGLELRVPLVDRLLLEAIAPIPSALRLAPGKRLLTQAVPEIPAWVIQQPKRGFFFPYESWMQGEWQDYLQDVHCPTTIPLSPWYRRWSLAVFQHWWRQVAP